MSTANTTKLSKGIYLELLGDNKLKVACPYCHQHFVFSQNDMSDSFQCSHCHQAFDLSELDYIDAEEQPQDMVESAMPGTAEFSSFAQEAESEISPDFATKPPQQVTQPVLPPLPPKKKASAQVAILYAVILAFFLLLVLGGVVVCLLISKYNALKSSLKNAVYAQETAGNEAKSEIQESSPTAALFLDMLEDCTKPQLSLEQNLEAFSKLMQELNTGSLKDADVDINPIIEKWQTLLGKVSAEQELHRDTSLLARAFAIMQSEPGRMLLENTSGESINKCAQLFVNGIQQELQGCQDLQTLPEAISTIEKQMQLLTALPLQNTDEYINAMHKVCQDTLANLSAKSNTAQLKSFLDAMVASNLQEKDKASIIAYVQALLQNSKDDAEKHLDTFRTRSVETFTGNGDKLRFLLSALDTLRVFHKNGLYTREQVKAEATFIAGRIIALAPDEPPIYLDEKAFNEREDIQKIRKVCAAEIAGAEEKANKEYPLLMPGTRMQCLINKKRSYANFVYYDATHDVFTLERDNRKFFVERSNMLEKIEDSAIDLEENATLRQKYSNRQIAAAQKKMQDDILKLRNAEVQRLAATNEARGYMLLNRQWRTAGEIIDAWFDRLQR